MKKFFAESWKNLRDSFLARWLFFAVIGVILLLVFHSYNLPEYFYSIPIALFSVVGYSIIEAADFQKFLRKEMLGVIQDSRYLIGLNRKRLDDMLENLHLVYYELPDKLPPDNLYQFVKDNILNKYIGKAYIESPKITYEFHNVPGGGYYKITITNKFAIRTMSDKKISDTLELSLAVTAIPGKTIEEHFPLDEWYLRIAEILEGSEIMREEVEKAKFTIEGEKCFYKMPFNLTRNQSLLIEAKRAGYEQEKDRTTHQIFSLPTHGFVLQIIVHDFGDVTFYPKFAGIPPSKPKRSEQISGTQFVMEYDGWMIPGNSVTITF